MKEYSLACDRNKQPILEKLQIILKNCHHVFEIGSGTGQHAVYFASHLQYLTWQSSDKADKLDSIQSWFDDSGLNNLAAPIVFDVAKPPIIAQPIDAVFTANTCHIMSIEEVTAMFHWVATMLPTGRHFILYGPFKYQGQYTSSSNEAFDQCLQSNKASQGIRDVEVLKEMSKQLHLIDDYDLPANNRLLVFEKQ